MSSPDQPTPPSGWGEAPRPPAYGQYGPGQYGGGSGGGDAGGGPATPPSPYGPAASKPGVVPLRPLSLGEVFDGSFSSVRHNPGVMLGLVTLVVVIATVAATVLAQVAVPWLTGLFSTAPLDDPEVGMLFPDAGAMAQVVSISLAMSLTLVVAQPIAEGVVTVSVSQSVIGRKLSVGEVWSRVRPRLGVLIGWMLLRTVGLFVGYTAAVVLVVLVVAGTNAATGSTAATVLVAILGVVAVVAAALWLWVRLLLVAPALVLEGRGLGSTLARAWRLTRGNYWRILGTILLASIIAGLAGQVVGVPLAFAGQAVDGTAVFGWGYLVASIVASVLTTLIYLIFVSGVVALVYTDVRMRREGLDVRLAQAAERAAAEQAGPAGPTAPGPPPTGSAPQW
ncbi:glycerophosphoryl diester phosphodiesterase membrane domain-containing protein [Isoptericola haloaureus]|uniref:Glycerophosphoryl diester phosphodiesterase membrane domain-containing protein n=1 Tax=Isoptericola haloaureus TaxID=1542902 RepID=A0ABU7ZAC4_9MICO